MAGETVLVTGGTGFIGAHTIIQLLSQGYKVRTTVRSLKREGDVRNMLKVGGGDAAAPIQFFQAELGSDDGWAQAVAGADFVLHIASPFPATLPEHEDDLIKPARDGALRVLKAARDGGVKRVVLTSSFAAIGYGQKTANKTFDETNWSDVNGPDIQPYAKSKTIAEKAAWDFIAKQGGTLELSVVNPVGVFGPVLAADYSTSILLIQRLMDGALPGCPRLYFGVVDVRDVADLHIRAMTNPAAKGERFLATVGDFMSILEIAQTLKAGLGDAAKRVPAKQIPDFIVRLVALADPAAKQLLPELGKFKNGANAKAVRMLGWKPRSREDACIATAQSLIDLGLLKDSPKKAA